MTICYKHSLLCSVVVSTRDSESRNPGSNPGKATLLPGISRIQKIVCAAGSSAKLKTLSTSAALCALHSIFP